MSKAKKTRKFATVKRVIGQRDARLKKNEIAQDASAQAAKKKKDDGVVREIPQMPSGLFFQSNENLRPPYSILIVRRPQVQSPLVRSVLTMVRRTPTSSQ